MKKTIHEDALRVMLEGGAVREAVAKALEPLRQEIAQLRLENAEQRRIEHQPPSSEPAPVAKPESFADLLAWL